MCFSHFIHATPAPVSIVRKLTRVVSTCALALVVATAAATRAAQLPERVDGWLYQETASGPHGIRISSGIRLNRDGSYAGVYSNGGLQGRLMTGAPPSGTWQYKKNADGTATLTLSDSLGARSLLVQGEENGTVSGSVSGPTIGLFPTFRLSPPGTTPSFSNSSIRAYVRPGGTAILGFILQNGSRTVLIRAVGPGLRGFGVTGRLADPKFTVRYAGGFLASENDDWDQPAPNGADSIRNTTTVVGAFPLDAGSKDAATVLTLPASAYTVQVTGATPDDNGEVLIEVYLLP